MQKSALSAFPTVHCSGPIKVKVNQEMAILGKVNRDRYNIDAPECKKKAYMDLDFRTLNVSEI